MFSSKKQRGGTQLPVGTGSQHIRATPSSESHGLRPGAASPRAGGLTSASASAEKGVSSAGLTTTVQPAARAAPTLRVIMALGKFHWGRRARPLEAALPGCS